MTTALDIVATAGAAVMLTGVLRSDAPNWRLGAMGAAANVVAALALTWPVIRLWMELPS